MLKSQHNSMHTELLSEEQVEKAASLLKKGELVAFPTETVYGLGAPLFYPEAIKKIFSTKGRAADNPLIVHLSSLEQLERVAIEVPEEFFTLSKIYFPGPLTMVLKRHPGVPEIVSGGLLTVALRMPSHPLARALIAAVGQPLVAPSANLSGKPSATTAAHVLEDFSGKISAVLDGGATTFGIESTVLSLCDPNHPVLLRPGTIGREELEKVLNRKIAEVTKVKEGEKVLSPGMKYRHYAPHAHVKLFFLWEELEQYLSEAPRLKRILLSALDLSKNFDNCQSLPLSSQGLYSHFRDADRTGCSEILVFCDSKTLLHAGLMNRLQRASER